MSDSWWDASKNPLIAMNPVRLQYIQRHTAVAAGTAGAADTSNTTTTNTTTPQQQPQQQQRQRLALDVGCGGGLLSESLARLPPYDQVVAIDPSESLVACAKAHAMASSLNNIDYRGGTTIEQLAAAAAAAASEQQQQQQQQGSFDTICILEVLEHATNVDSMLEAAAQLLSKRNNDNNSRLFISTLNATIQSQWLAIYGAEYIMGYLPIGTHDFSKFLSPALLKEKLDKVGLEEAAPPMGMVLTRPPPMFGVGGSWEWELSETDLNVNWIGVYQHKTTKKKD
mmetsp:Transcript_25912/g.43185  ORF Transcript_25912/g.43185 Transcript_25912/m.43185 type:complete len:283 (-) Transcript_25912:58-906(-)